MKNFVLFIRAIFDAVIGFVVAFVKSFIPEKSFDHSGFQTFVGKTRSIAVEVTLRFNAWLSGLQHSPTV